MKDRFLIVRFLKLYILSLDNYLENYPKKERVLKDRIINDSYDVLEMVSYANFSDDKGTYKFEILSKLSMLDFYFEKSLKSKYLSEKQFNKVSNDLAKISKMIFGWLKDEGKDNSS